MNDKYLQYQLEDFLADDAFVNWVKAGENNESWKTWLKKNPGLANEVNEAKLLISQIQFAEEIPPESAKNALWERIAQSTSTKIRELDRGRIIMRYAAIFAVAASLIFLVLIRTGGEVRMVNEGRDAMIATLPSASTVELIGHTSILYNKKKWNEERTVDLEGEAVFDVTKGVPFVVNTRNGSVRVLGTKFKVVSRDDSFLVIVESGRVEVISGKDKQVLIANENFVKGELPSDPGFAKRELRKEAATTFHFERKDLQTVLTAIESVYEVEFVYDLDAQSTYNGSFNSRETLENVLEKVLWPNGISYTIKNSQVYLSVE